MDFSNINTFKNLTPHIVSVLVNGTFVNIQPSGSVARLSIHCDSVGEVMGIPVSLCHEGLVRNLPDPEEGVMYIVSSLVGRAVNREDVVSPDTSEDGAIRDGKGNVIGVRRFQSFYRSGNK